MHKKSKMKNLRKPFIIAMRVCFIMSFIPAWKIFYHCSAASVWSIPHPSTCFRYAITLENHSFSEAALACSRLGGGIVRLDALADFLAANDILNGSTTQVWVNLTIKDGEYKWKNGSQIPKTMWRQDDPNSIQSPACIRLTTHMNDSAGNPSAYNHLLADNSCDSPFHGLCQKPVSSSLTARALLHVPCNLCISQDSMTSFSKISCAQTCVLTPFCQVFSFNGSSGKCSLYHFSEECCPRLSENPDVHYYKITGWCHGHIMM